MLGCFAVEREVFCEAGAVNPLEETSAFEAETDAPPLPRVTGECLDSDVFFESAHIADRGRSGSIIEDACILLGSSTNVRITGRRDPEEGGDGLLRCHNRGTDGDVSGRGTTPWDERVSLFPTGDVEKGLSTDILSSSDWLSSDDGSSICPF